MKALKYILLLLLILIIGGAIYFALLDGTYDITETKVIDAPPSLVYEEIEDFKNWENWNGWLDKEDVELTLGQQTSGVDAYFTFEDEHGDGKMVITGLDPNKRVSMDMTYDSGLAVSNSDVTMVLEPVEQGTQITWNIKGEQGLIEKAVGKVFGIDMEEEIRPMYTQSLNQLDAHLQKEMAIYSTNVDGIIQTGGGYYLYMSSSANMDNFSAIMGQMLQNIMAYMQRNNIDMYGMPMSIYEKFDPTNNSVIFSAAIPVKDRVITETDSNVLCSYREPGKAVKVTLKGSYEHLQEAWNQGQNFIQQNGLQEAEAPPYEIYKTDPSLTPNPANFLTEVYLPIQ
ncbi:SRPBCC family protein [Nonlabens xiamenensis]|uniref:SRPBCC family protein n=1 Tax=Nonlabens xiamenensis TaxID=2341043 RepID=UPI000F6137A4|nr:SRPBCC family protein [Nonlabens xiamenensis]